MCAHAPGCHICSQHTLRCLEDALAPAQLIGGSVTSAGHDRLSGTPFSKSEAPQP